MEQNVSNQHVYVNTRVQPDANCIDNKALIDSVG